MNRWQLCHSCMLIGIFWIVFFPMTAAGQLLVADFGSNQILEYNLDGISTNFSFSTPSSPSAMAIGSGTDLFVASQNTGTVFRYNWLTGGCRGTFNTGLNGLGGLLYDNASNSLFVSEFNNYQGHQIIKYNATSGAQIGVLDVVTSMDLADMALGADGSLYVSSFWDGSVYRYNSTTCTFTALSGTSGVLSGANGLVFDSSGNLDVVGMLTNNIFQFNSSGTAVGNLIAGSSGGLSFPSDIVIDPDGNLLISNMGDWSQNGFISKYNSITKEINPSFITSLVKPTAMLIEPAVWKGGAAGIDSWKNAANWRGTPPGYPLPIIFGAVTSGHVTNFNDYALGTQFNGITFTVDAPQYTIQGNAIKLGGPVVNQSAHDQDIDLAMELLPDLGVLFDTGGHNITVGGLISGDGSLIKKGAGTLSLEGGVSYSGSTTVTGGTLDIAGPLYNSPAIDVEGAGCELLAQSIVADTLTIGAGATVVIKAIPGGPLGRESIQAVPEPGTVALLVMAGLLSPLVFLPQRWKT